MTHKRPHRQAKCKILKKSPGGNQAENVPNCSRKPRFLFILRSPPNNNLRPAQISAPFSYLFCFHTSLFLSSPGRVARSSGAGFERPPLRNKGSSAAVLVFGSWMFLPATRSGPTARGIGPGVPERRPCSVPPLPKFSITGRVFPFRAPRLGRHRPPGIWSHPHSKEDAPIPPLGTGGAHILHRPRKEVIASIRDICLCSLSTNTLPQLIISG